MLKMLSHWKTTATGLACILASSADVIHYVMGDATAPDLRVSIAAIIAGIGLVAASDA